MRVAAVTLNFNDLDGIHGRYKTVPTPVPYIPGMEVLGTVERGGAGTEAWVGATVVGIPAMAFGGYAEYAVVPAAMAFVMPDDIALPDAAAIFMPFHLGWLALYERGRLQRGRDAARARRCGRRGLGRDPARRARRRARASRPPAPP